MILAILTPSAVTLLAFALFSIVVLLTFAVAYAKRDITIDITLFELH